MRTSILLLALFLGIALSGNIKVGKDVTVAGLSSGAFMAVQMHVAFSQTIRGAAVFAGGPYYCAEGQMMKALTNCMSMGTGINVSGIKSKISTWESAGKIDSSSNLSGSKVFIFAGTSDYTVSPKVDKVAEDLYQSYGVQVSHNFNFAAGHTMPTVSNGNTCTMTMSPFIGKCNYNGALESLNYLNNGKFVEGNSNVSKSNLFKVSQTTSGTVMGPDAYVYAPAACQEKKAKCPLHVVFHGCKQTINDIGTQYVENTGYNEVAESNNVVILYPQAVSSMLSNPNGCWDWWGYTNGDYATKSGVQMAEVNRLIKGLQNGDFGMTQVYPTETTVDEMIKVISE